MATVGVDQGKRELRGKHNSQ